MLVWERGDHPKFRPAHVESEVSLRHPSGYLGPMLGEERRPEIRACESLVCFRGNGDREGGCGWG